MRKKCQKTLDIEFNCGTVSDEGKYGVDGKEY
jgi:hypothetical protein